MLLFTAYKMIVHQWCRRRGCRGYKRTPKCVDLLKIWEKFLKIWAKPLKNSVKSLKIRAKMAPDVAWLQKMAPNICRKAQLRPLFSRSHQKQVFIFFVGENLWATGAQKLFGQVWGNSGKILRTPKNLPAPTPKLYIPRRLFFPNNSYLLDLSLNTILQLSNLFC